MRCSASVSNLQSPISKPGAKSGRVILGDESESVRNADLFSCQKRFFVERFKKNNISKEIR